MTFETIRSKFPDWDSAYPDDWEKPTKKEIESIEKEFGIQYSEQFVEFQLIESHRTPMGDFAFDDFGWANPKLGPANSLREKVKDASEVGVPKDLAPFKDDNGDYFCITKEGKVVIWDHNSNGIEQDKNYQWESFIEWLDSTFEE